jgi:SAM-dependent methyltransferase
VTGEADRGGLDLRQRYEDEARTVFRYDSASFWDGRYHRRRFSLIRDRLHSLLPTAQHFLDVGCGSGEYLALAHQLGVPGVFGTDLSFGYCHRASDLSSADAVLQASADMLPLEGSSIDVVLCSEVLEHLPPAISTRAITELCRVARHAIVITTPNNDAAIRNIARRLRPDAVERLDAEVGHINLLGLDQWSRLVGSIPGWRVATLESAHVLPPVVGERLHFPSSIAPLVDRIEDIMTQRSPRSGNCLVVVLERHQQQDDAR